MPALLTGLDPATLMINMHHEAPDRGTAEALRDVCSVVSHINSLSVLQYFAYCGGASSDPGMWPSLS